GQAQLPRMAVAKFRVSTEATPPIMGAARSSASSETSKVRSSSSVATARMTSPPVNTMSTHLPPPGLPMIRGQGTNCQLRWYFTVRSHFDLDQTRHETRVTVCRGLTMFDY